MTVCCCNPGKETVDPSSREPQVYTTTTIINIITTTAINTTSSTTTLTYNKSLTLLFILEINKNTLDMKSYKLLSSSSSSL
jgi:hypothetical protein